MTICSPNILKNGISDCRDKLSEDLSGQKQTERIFYQIFFQLKSSLASQLWDLINISFK